MGGNTLWGATPQEWDHFSRVMGLTPHLLPVLSAPGYQIAPRSKLKALGKVPSVLNNDGFAVGFGKWSTLKPNVREVQRWAANPSYGVCIITRYVRAIDIDVESEAEVMAIEAAVYRELGVLLPTRFRRNSSKVLLAFACEGIISKRTFRTQHGLVEFLGTGQQFIAAGSHWRSKPNEPSGARYEWAGGLPAVFPEITEDAFKRLWEKLIAEFALPGSATGGADRERRRGLRFDATDGVGEFLQERGLVLDEGNDGALYVTCPWEHEHTTDSGPTATAWFPAGTGGYEQGHFKCLHAHCASRTDFEFLAAVGYTLADMEAVPIEQDRAPDEAAKLPAMPALKSNRQDRIDGTLANVAKALRYPFFAERELGFDEALDAIVTRRDSADAWRPIDDGDGIALRIMFEERRRFEPIAKETMRDALYDASRANRFDSIKEWIGGLEWDGVPRIETFLADYFGAEATPYTRAVGRYWWTAQAGRALQPGVQADMVPVLAGPQGAGKTQALKALVPSIDQFVEINLKDDDDKLARKMRGSLLGEIAELRGLRSRDADSIKAWVTRQVEEWVPKYIEHTVKYPRRVLLVGTTNDDEFLDDVTGERRWLPVKVGPAVRLEGLAEARDQLWAEGRTLFEAGGIDWREAQELAQLEHEHFKVRDVWETSIALALDENKVEQVTVREVAVGILGLDERKMSKAEEMRIGKILRVRGFAKARVLRNGVQQVIWCRNIAHLAHLDAGGVQ